VAIGAGRLFEDADNVANIVGHERVAPDGQVTIGLRRFFGDEELFFNGELKAFMPAFAFRRRCPRVLSTLGS
jgi:hypothetical protein